MIKGSKHSEEIRKKISERTKQAHADPAMHERFVKSHIGLQSGEKNPNWGKHPSEDTKKKMSEAAKRMWENPDHRKNMSENHKGLMKGEKSPCFGKHLPDEQKKKISESNRGKKHNFGNHHSEEWKKMISEMNKGQNNPMFGKHLTKEQKEKFSGEKHYNWKGGISHLPYCEKFDAPFRERVRSFFGYMCVECGTPEKGKKHHVHHVNFRKDSCCSEDAPKLFVILCGSCHSKTQHNKEFWINHFTDMINSYFGGKCYFTKEEFERLCLCQN